MRAPTSSAAPAHRARAANDQGFTLVEVLVAVMIIAIVITAALTVFDVSTRATFNAERSQIAVNEAQNQMEDLKALDYDQLALTSTPAASTDPLDSRHRISGARFQLTDGDNSSLADMVINGQSGVSAGTVNPGPTSFTDGGLSGKVYRFIVWQDDPRCPSTCPGTHDFKRAVVAVKLDSVGAATGGTRYIEIQSDFADPHEGVQGSAPPPAAGQTVTAQQFFLTDTSCDHTTRQPITADHLVHNTLGTCSAGVNSGTTAGAPDLLYFVPPPDPDVNDVSNPPYYDYAIDIEPTVNPQSDKGLQLRRPNADGCAYTPASSTEPNAHEVVHRWVSPQMSTNFVATGKATLNFFTRTLNQTIQPANLCIWLFTRNAVGVDTLLRDQNTSLSNFSYQLNNWPHSSGWTEDTVQLNFSQVAVAANDQLGLAVGIERADTPAAIEFLYDHPEASSRLEVATTTPISGL